MVPLSGKEKKELVRQLSDIIPSLGSLLTKKANAVEYKMEDGNVIALDGVPILIRLNDYIIPTLQFVQSHNVNLPIVKVDTGAIKFVTNGADVMRPGIVWIDPNVVENEPVLIVEETRNSPLAIGISKYDAVDMDAMEKGKAIKVLHHLTDKYWKFSP